MFFRALRRALLSTVGMMLLLTILGEVASAMGVPSPKKPSGGSPPPSKGSSGGVPEMDAGVAMTGLTALLTGAALLRDKFRISRKSN